MFSCPTVTAVTPLRQARVLVIAEPPPAPPVQWPWPTPHRNGRDGDERCIRVTASDMAKLRRWKLARDYEPDPAQPCQPVPSDRDLLSAIFGPWQSLTHDLLLRGWCSPQGVRVGRWEVCTLDDRVVAVIRYWDGVAMGHADLLDAGGFTYERAFLYDGVTISRRSLPYPILDAGFAGPGPLPLGIPRRRVPADGSWWDGLERDGQRVGPWLGYHANGKLAAIRHYHLDSGAPIGLWEYYDEDGLFMYTRPVLE